MVNSETHMMEVRIGRRVQWRSIECIDVFDGPVPVLYDGERLERVLGSDIPIIIQGPLDTRYDTLF